MRRKDGRKQVAALREQRVQGRAVVFEPAAFIAQAEAHVRALVLDAEVVQQRNEARIGPVVEHDEAGVDREAPALPVDVDRVRVAADVRAGFEHRDVVLAMQACGDDQAGDARTNDGDAHEKSESD